MLRRETYLDLINVDVLVLFLHLLVRDLHCTDRGHLQFRGGLIITLHVLLLYENACSTHGILQILGGHLCLLHVESLLSELGELSFVHFLLLQDPHCPLGNSRLEGRGQSQRSSCQAWQVTLTFPGPAFIFDICVLKTESSPSSFLILTSMLPILVSVCEQTKSARSIDELARHNDRLTELMASDRLGFGLDLLLPNICKGNMKGDDSLAVPTCKAGRLCTELTLFISIGDLLWCLTRVNTLYCYDTI